MARDSMLAIDGTGGKDKFRCRLLENRLEKWVGKIAAKRGGRKKNKTEKWRENVFFPFSRQFFFLT